MATPLVDDLPIAHRGTRPWRAFALLAVAYFMTIVDLTIVNVSLPTIDAHLHFADGNLQWVVTAYGLMFGGFLLLGGRAADLLGRRRLLMIGLAVFTAASVGCGLARTDTLLIVMRGLQGLGAAAVLPAALSSVLTIFPEGAGRNRALGVWGAIGAMGATVGLLAGGALTRYVGWPAVFFVNVPVGLTALALAPRVVPESRAAAGRRTYDPWGALSVTGALVLVVLAISRAPQQGWSSGQTVVPLALAAALFAAFVTVEARIDAPLLPLALLRSRTVAGSNIVGFLTTGSFYTFIFVGTLYLQDVLHYSALQTGCAWLAASGTAFLAAPLSQLLVTRTSPKLVMAIGMTLVGSGILWASRVPVDGAFWPDLFGPFVVTGVGVAFAFIPVSIGGLAGVTDSDAGVASGVLSTNQELGGAIGVAIASSVAAARTAALGRNGSPGPEAMTGGFHTALLVCGLTAFLALPVLALLVRRTDLTAAVAHAGAAA